MSRSVSEVGVAVLALVKCECDERALAEKKIKLALALHWHWGMGNGDYKESIEKKKKLAAEFKPPSPITAGAVTYNE